MVKPISLRLRHAAILREARATLARAGDDAGLRQVRNSAILHKAREVSARAQEQRRLKRAAALAANKAILAVRQAYFQMDKIDATEFERAAWNARKELVLDELRKIVEGRRP